MARTPQWRIDDYLGKVFVGEYDQIQVKVTNVDDPNFCIAEDAEGNPRNIPWRQMENGFYQRV